MHLSPFAHELVKLSHITVLTGSMGTGKSTWAAKNKDQFDLVLGTDTGRPVGGKYVPLSKQERNRIRRAKDRKILAAHRAGKRVLLEGHPRALYKAHPKILAAADEKLVMGTGSIRRLIRVAKRSGQRGTSRIDDLTFAMKHMKHDREAWERIQKHGPFKKVHS